ncbi:MAG: DUF1569 domain-containing protein [Bryobacteraceae bacterium]|jgi:hypothetical protein
MSTLAEPNVRTKCSERIARLDPNVSPKWGRMTAPQMICHLNDSFRVGAGEKYASPDTNLFKQTVFKWAALHSPFPWPHGVPTRPELMQGTGGTPPANWDSDCATLRAWMHAFADRTTFAVHPIFGEMSRADWLIWGYRHIDHHLRQFGQ